MIALVEYPKRRYKLALTVFFSLLVHGMILTSLYFAPVISIAVGLSRLEFVDEEYDNSILINFRQPFRYPAGYLGFSAPKKTRSLEEIKREDERRARREAARLKRQKEREEAERLAAEKAAAEQLAAEEKARAELAAKTETPAEPESDSKKDTYPGGFGKINTAPIKDQIQRLYTAHKEGKLAIPQGKFKVGVSGSINPDGTLSDYKITIPSGIQEIDAAAYAILDAVSVSRALGPLHNLTSLSMILDIDDVAQLNVVGFASSEQDARAIVDLANAVLLYTRFKKADDPGAMIMLKNLKVWRDGKRIHADIKVPRQEAADTLTKTMNKGQT
ncbi:MAG: hypothetical protein L0220_23265 [Acidobacteria bacterium]|nr:hypothetical protein [Acidobacteriota bacterium]